MEIQVTDTEMTCDEHGEVDKIDRSWERDDIWIVVHEHCKEMHPEVKELEIRQIWTTKITPDAKLNYNPVTVFEGSVRPDVSEEMEGIDGN